MRVFAAVPLVSCWPTSSVAVLQQYGSYRSKSGSGRRTLKPALLNPKRHFAVVICRIAKDLFDDLVGAGEQLWWNFEADGLRGFQVDDQFKLDRLHDWQVSRFVALQNFARVVAG